MFGSIIGSAIGAIASGIGGSKDREANAQQAALNYEQQKEFAQNGIQWKVADARAAGIHPLFALNAPTTSFSSTMYDPGYAGQFSNIGQDISRAIDATRSQEDKNKARMEALMLEKGELENDLLRSQISRLNAPHTGPAIPTVSNSSLVIDGQGDSANGSNPRVLPDTVWFRGTDGNLYRSPSPEFAAANQNVISGFIPEIKHLFRNQILPIISSYGKIRVPGYSPRGADQLRERR